MTAGVAARRRFERARTLVEAQQFQAGVDLLSGIVAELDGQDADAEATRLLVRALTACSTALREVGRDADAREMASRAWRLAEESGFDDLLVAAISVSAYNQTRSGDPGGALETLDGAAAALPRIDAEDRLRFLLNRAFAGLACGQVTRAIADLRLVESEGQAAGLFDLAQKARHNLGYVAFMRGDLPRALELMASTVTDPDDVPSVARLATDPISQMDRAQVLSEAGLVDDADDLLQDALVGLAGRGRLQDEGEVHLARARVRLIDGDHDGADDHSRRALEAFVRRGNRRWIRRARFMQLAIGVERGQREVWDTAGRAGEPTVTGGLRTLVEEVAELARTVDETQDPELSESTRFMVAEAALLAGDDETARQALAGGGPSETATLSVRMRWYRARAGLAASTDPDSLLATVSEALGVLSSAQGRLGSLDLRTAMAIHGRELAQLGVEHALRVGEDDAVHTAVEESHASSTRLAPVRAAGSGPDRDELAHLRRLRQGLWDIDADRQPDEAVRLRARVAHVEQSLRRHGWHRSGQDERVDVVSLSDAMESLRVVGAAAVSYARVGSRLHAVRIDDRGLSTIRLGEVDHLDELVQRLRSDLQAVVLTGIPAAVRRVMRRSIDDTLVALDRELLAPVHLGDAPVVVVPHGPLALVPWGLLPSRRRAATTVTPCLTSWRRCTRRHRGRGGVDEAITASSTRVDVVAMAGPGLERADAEVEAIAGVWPGARATRGAGVTGSAATRALGEADIVHLASHGVHQSTSPLFSSVFLHDGPLFAHELDHRVQARLVVLSACEVGSQTIREGDEPLGLTAALLEAGTPTVVAGLARVRDEVAHDVMIEVHRNLRTGLDPARALSEAMDDALGDGQVAPFGCLGAGLLPIA